MDETKEEGRLIAKSSLSQGEQAELLARLPVSLAKHVEAIRIAATTNISPFVCDDEVKFQVDPDK